MIRSTVEAILERVQDRDEAADMAVRSIGGWLPGPDRHMAPELVKKAIDKAYPKIYGTGAQYQSSRIDGIAKRAKRGEIQRSKFVLLVKLHLPESRQGDAEAVADAAFRAARTG